MVAERKIDELGAALADRWLSEEEFYQQIGAGATTVYDAINAGDYILIKVAETFLPILRNYDRARPHAFG